MFTTASYRLPALGLLAASAVSPAVSTAHAQSPGCNALELTRSPSYVRVQHNDALVPNRITVEAWIQVASNSSGKILSKQSSSTGQHSWELSLNDLRLTFAIRGSSTRVATLAPSTARVPMGVPTHVAASWDGSTTRLYVNGRRVASSAARVGTPLRTAGELRIGQGSVLQSKFQFLGRLDEVRIWNTVLSDAQIANFRTRILSGLPGQVASYSFDGSLFDSSSQRFHGQLVGSGATFQPLRGPLERLTERANSTTSKVFRLGDINGDGYEDYGVGQRAGLNDSTTRGALRVYSGFDHRQLFAFEGQRDGNLFGNDADGGDINGDGIPEVLVGEPGHSNKKGRIWVIDGRTRQLRVFAEGTGSASFGLVVRAMPYLDADGRCDVITTEGDKVRGLRADGSVLWTRTPSNGKSVVSLDKLGDITGDGFDDFICGVPTFSRSQDLVNEGLARIGSGRNGAALFRIAGGVKGRRYAKVVVGVQGDIDGDKIPDFLIASPFATGLRGRLTVRSGKTRRKIYPSITGQRILERLGLAASALRGDATGDGFPDMLISNRNGNQGRVHIFDIRNGRFRVFATGSSNSPDFGQSIAGLNTDGDRIPDVVLAHGKVKAQVHDRCPVARAPQQQIYGAICRGSSNRHPRLAVVDKARARVASSYTMRVASARPRSAVVLQLGVGRSNVALDALGMRGCRLLVATTLLSLVSPVDAKGYADVTLPVPDDATLAGVRVNYQALCLDQGGNAFGLTATNGAEIVHGSK